jgi:beta-aspartyl-peptidase (threonine type)
MNISSLLTAWPRTTWLNLTLVTLFLLVGMSCTKSEKSSMQDQSRKEYAIAIHGGAGVISKDIPEERKQQYVDALNEALDIGEGVLKEGGSALDAVEQTINYLENNPLFNAGKGAVFTAEGKHELDAAIMDGTNLNAGTITGVRTVKNPISLARKVMTESKHVMFSWDGAEQFADQMGMERVENSYFSTERRRKQWERANEQQSGTELLYRGEDPDFWDGDKFGTVGCVALDKEGRLAAGTSTGGMTNKRFGRVGDVPIVGAGTYANDMAAISATGWGERIMLHTTGSNIAHYMEYKGVPLKEATNYVIFDELEDGTAGIISVDKYGNISMPFNTKGMFRAAADAEGFRTVAIWENAEM